MANQELAPAPPEGAIKVYEPAMKDPNDQLVYALEQIQAYQMPPVDGHQNMADPSNPFVSVFTGRGELQVYENMQAAMSPPPLLPEESSPLQSLLAVAGVFALAYFLFLKGK